MSLLKSTLYFTAPLLLLMLLSKRFPLASFILGLLTFYTFLAVCSIYGVFASLFLRLIGRAGLSQWATGRSFKYALKYFSGVEFVISDPHNYLGSTRPAIFIGNHQTELDVLMLGTIFPQYCSVTAKSSLKKTPFLGWFMALSGSVFIDRTNRDSARTAMSGAAQEIKSRRQSVYMFPEGTRSYYKEPGFLPFKKGAFHLAVQAQVPIVPVVVSNYSDVLYVQGWWYKPANIMVKVLKPIETKNLTPADVEDLARDTRDLMLREHIALTELQRGHSVAMPAQQNRQSIDGSNKGGVVKASGTDGQVL